MATTPSVARTDASSASAPAKLPLVSLVPAILIAVLLGIGCTGGAMFYLVRSGRVPLQKNVVEKVASTPAASHAMVLEPMVANLADTGGAAYLKLTLTLLIADEPAAKNASKEEKPAKGISADDAAVRDTVLMVVGQQTAEQLLAPDGKLRLKSELKAALAKHNPKLKVMDLYFTDFLVQR